MNRDRYSRRLNAPSASSTDTTRRREEAAQHEDAEKVRAEKAQAKRVRQMTSAYEARKKKRAKRARSGVPQFSDAFKGRASAGLVWRARGAVFLFLSAGYCLSSLRFMGQGRLIEWNPIQEGAPKHCVRCRRFGRAATRPP